MADILAIMPVRNESDIIEATVGAFLAGGIPVHIMDDWSTDGTWEILNGLVHPLLTLERWPAGGPGETWDYEAQLARVEEIALAHPDEWILPMGADEILIPPWPGVGLMEAFARVSAGGYNFVEFELFDFVPTADGFMSGEDPVAWFTHGYINRGCAYRRFFIQPEGSRAQIAVRACHDVIIPNRKIYPERFIVKHYPLRSSGQGIRKVADRFSRFSPVERAKGWHTHYSHINEAHNFIADETGFVRFEDAFPQFRGDET